MDYTILDSAGNALASFADDELAAHATLHAMVAIEPEAAENVVLLAYDVDGMPVGQAVTFYECPPPVTVREPQGEVLQPSLSESFVRIRVMAGQYVGTWGSPVRRDSQAVPA